MNTTTSQPEATASDAIAQMAAQVRFEDLDAATVQAARLRILDVLGCALGGTRAAGCDALVQIARDTGGRQEATLVGASGVKVPAATAAMVNAILARSFDYEVMGVLIEGRLIPSHHAATTVMTALALCEARGLGGKDLITALVVGDDIAARTLAASGLDFGQGWDGSATYTALGAAAAAGRLLGLDGRRIRDAMGLVVEQIGGTIQTLWDGSPAFKLGQGTAGRNAVFAAQLAAAGWTGMHDPLLGRAGFFAQYTAGCTDAGVLQRDLGRRFWAEAYYKPYPACMATHVCIEAATAATGGRIVEADAVESVTVRLPAPLLANFCGKPFEAREYPHTDAIFSYRHMVACVLLRGGVRQEHYDEERLREPVLRAITERIALAPLAPGRTGSEIEVVLRNGTVLRGEARAPSRSPLVQVATAQEIEDKFRRQAAFSGRLGAEDADRLLHLVNRLEEHGSVEAVAELLAAADSREFA